MQIITRHGFYFLGTAKELRSVLANLCNHYITVTDLINKKNKKPHKTR